MKINFNIDDFKLTILPVYMPYLEDYNKRINVFYGGAGSGKSVFITQKLLYKLLKSKRKCLVVRKTGATLRSSIFEEFKSRIAECGLSSYCKINKTDLTIELPNGSTFLFRGLDDQEKIKSISGIDDIVIEEATELLKEDFEQLNLRLRSKKKHQQIHLMFNPVSKQNWVFKYFGFDKDKPKKYILIVKTTYLDNNFLPQKYIDEMNDLKATNYAWWKIYANGDFSTLDKRIFTNWEVFDFDIDTLKEIKTKELLGLGYGLPFLENNPIYKNRLRNIDKIKFYFGLDWGYNDPTALIACLVDINKKELYIFDEHYERFMTNDTIGRMIKGKKYSKEQIVCDSANPKDIEDLKRRGIRAKGAKKGKDSIMNGIRRLQQFKILIHPNCQSSIMEFENYTWQKDRKSGQYIDRPIDKYCHLIDALRYATEGLGRTRIEVLK